MTEQLNYTEMNSRFVAFLYLFSNSYVTVDISISRFF